ncbi:MAG: aldolase/citrate lyase family protein [Actinomycetota bacterium]
MTSLSNPLRDRLVDRAAPVQFALFLQLSDPMVAEICAGAGFEVIVIDTEHGPSGVTEVITQLQAVAAGGADAAVRVTDHDPGRIKRVLDAGATTIIAPMIDTAENARRVVAATRYPPAGVRGAASARAARWGRVADYHATADAAICVIAMIESSHALANLEEICAVDGIDVAFVGPTDLATSLGRPGAATQPDVVEVVEAAIRRIAAADVVPAVFAGSPELADRYVAAGARLVAAGVDSRVLALGTDALRQSLGD